MKTRTEVHTMIDQLNEYSLAYLLRQFPRLQGKFRQILRDETDDENIHPDDVSDVWLAQQEGRRLP